MKVKTLIELLKKCPQDALVIMQKDAEGNGYSPMSGVDPNCFYVEESSWDGIIYDLEWTADDAGVEPEEWEQMKKDNPKAVCLFPIN